MGKCVKYTVEQENWLLDNFQRMDSYEALVNEFNSIFSTDRSMDALRQKCIKGLKLKPLSNENHFTEEQELWLVNKYCQVGSYDELVKLFNERFGTRRTKSSIQEKCSKSLKLKSMPNPSQYGVKEKEQLPIGTIRKSQTGTYIKVKDAANSHISGYQEPYWLPLQKKIYQDAYGKIGPEQMVCFLDGNHDNFELDNLCCIDRRISAIMSSNKWWTDSKDHTHTAIKWCELYLTLKEIGKEKNR